MVFHVVHKRQRIGRAVYCYCGWLRKYRWEREKRPVTDNWREVTCKRCLNRREKERKR